MVSPLTNVASILVLGSILVRSHTRVEFVVGSGHAFRVFLRVLRFSPSTKPNISKFQVDQERGTA